MNATKLTGHNSLSPAYGRDYKSGKDAKADFLAGKDFILNHCSGRSLPCSITDFVVGASAQLRFKRLSGVCVVIITQKMLDARLASHFQ